MSDPMAFISLDYKLRFTAVRVCARRKGFGKYFSGRDQWRRDGVGKMGKIQGAPECRDPEFLATPMGTGPKKL